MWYHTNMLQRWHQDMACGSAVAAGDTVSECKQDIVDLMQGTFCHAEGMTAATDLASSKCVCSSRSWVSSGRSRRERTSSRAVISFPLFRVCSSNLCANQSQ